MNLISKSLLFYIDSRRILRTIYTGNFEKIDSRIKQSNDENYNKVNDNIQLVEKEIYFQTYIKDSENSPKICFHNTIFICQKAENCFFIGNKDIIFGELKNWKNVIKNEIKHNNWSYSFLLTKNIFHGENFMFSGIIQDEIVRKEKMKVIRNF